MSDPARQSPFDAPSDLSTPSRRAVLRTAGWTLLAGGGAAALAACSSSPTGFPAPAGPSPAPASTSASSAPSSGASSSSAAHSSSASVPSGPHVAKAQVPEGGGIILDNADYVVTQPSAGTYKAFSKICTHAGCPVAEIQNQQIICNCHGSHYSIVDGSVISGPAPSPLPPKSVTPDGSDLVISG